MFHLVGTPPLTAQTIRALMHHTLGNGDFDVFRRMSDPVVCASAVMTPENVVYETERLMSEALYHLRPVYMAFPADLALQPARGSAQSSWGVKSDPVVLPRVVDAILSTLNDAKTACPPPRLPSRTRGAAKNHTGDC